MVANSRIWLIAGGFHRIRIMFLVHFVGLLVYREDGLTVRAQVLDNGQGKVFMNKKELDVKSIAGNATQNNANCGGLDGCSAACSPMTCYPAKGEPRLCTTVDNNEFHYLCASGACKNKIWLDYNRSFVTLPAAPASTNLRTECVGDICLQRFLDSTFKTVSVPSEYYDVYFGSASGAFREFPGREQNETQCTSYDPRWRPWYLNGISVTRDFKILVDVADSMGHLVLPDYDAPSSSTYLDVAKNMTLGLLQTLSAQDCVEVFSFDSVTATSLGGPCPVSPSYEYPSNQTELAPLVTRVKSLAQSSVTAGSSDLNGAVRRAANSFKQNQSLKVIIVLSNGLFDVNSTTFPSEDLQNKKAKLFVYKLPTNDDGGDTFLLKTSLQKDICSVNGSFELLDALGARTNPLYSMRSYFTYLAQIQLSAVGNNVTWSKTYENYFQQKIDVTTATFPAFGSDGLLIGVAGIDVVLDMLDESLKTSVLKEFENRNRGTIPAPSSISMTCSYQNAPANSTCPGSTVPDSSAICPRDDSTSSPLSERICCGSCGSGEVPKNNGLKPWMIAPIAIALVVLVAICVAGMYYWRSRESENGRTIVPAYTYPGPDQ